MRHFQQCYHMQFSQGRHLQLFILGKIKRSIIQWTGSTHGTSQLPDAMRVCVIHPIIHHMSSIDKKWGHSNGSQNWMNWTPSVTCLFFFPRLIYIIFSWGWLHRQHVTFTTRIHSQFKTSIQFSRFTFTRIGTFEGDQVTRLQQFVAIWNEKIRWYNAATVSTMREYMHYISRQASNTTFFFSYKHFPEGTTRKFHCFFEGSVQLHVPKSTWLPGRPFWSLVSEQLRRSSFGINCVL